MTEARCSQNVVDSGDIQVVQRSVSCVGFVAEGHKMSTEPLVGTSRYQTVVLVAVLT